MEIYKLSDVDVDNRGKQLTPSTRRSRAGFSDSFSSHGNLLKTASSLIRFYKDLIDLRLSLSLSLA